MKLTKQQERELRLCANEPQPTYGKGRARVQNILKDHGLVLFVDDGFKCAIREGGRAHLRALDAIQKEKPRWSTRK